MLRARLFSALILVAGIPVTGWCDADSAVNVDTPLEPCPPFGVTVYADQGEPGFRCKLLTQMVNRGLELGSDTGYQTMAELARPFVTTIQLSGRAELPRQTLDFLLANLSDTAQLINLYERTRYRIDYLNSTRSRFFATNNRSMQATFRQFLTRIDGNESDYLLFERGEARLLFWRFRGSTILEFNLIPQAQATDYQIMIHIFSNSSGYHSFFESALFKYLIRNLVFGVVDKISRSAAELSDTTGVVPPLSEDFVQTVRQQLNADAARPVPSYPPD